MPRGRPKGSVNKPISQLTPEQSKALKDINAITERMLDSYRALLHPNYEDVVKLDDTWMNLRYQFRKELTHD